MLKKLQLGYIMSSNSLTIIGVRKNNTSITIEQRQKLKFFVILFLLNVLNQNLYLIIIHFFKNKGLSIVYP